MGSRSRPHRVLSVCVCVCVSRCLWVCVIEANSLQLRVITIGLYQFLSRSPSCQILAVCGRRLRGVSGSWFPRFLSPAAFLDSDRRRLVCPLLPCATRLSPYGKLRFCLRKAPFLPTESSASAYGKLRVCLRKLRPSAYGKLRLVSRCVLLLVINSLFPQLNPPVFIVTEGSDLKEVFSKSRAASLPPHRPYDCAIDLVPGMSPPKGRLYSLSVPEREAMEKYISDSLTAGFIRPSSSPAGAGFFFVAKKDGSLRPCIDYRGLNNITVKNTYPLPLMSSAFERLQGASIFTKLDLRNAYHLVRIREGDECSRGC